MAKKSSQKRTNRHGTSGTWSPPQLKIFRPLGWHKTLPNRPTEYISHLLQELGRLGLSTSDIERHERAPNTRTILSDLLAWLDGNSHSAVANLMDWRHLDLRRMSERVKQDRKAKPRIEISATITKMNNLSVCWHPGGWSDSWAEWGNRGDHGNLIESRRWKDPPDFWRFAGDEEPTFQGRATNELMYVRGVGHLNPEPRENYGPYAIYNRDVVDSILICAVRSAYELLVAQLQASFDVAVMHAFDFVTREETRGDNPRLDDWPINRVISWSLEDAAQVRIRHQRADEAEKERRERRALETVADTYGCPIEAIIERLLIAYSSRSRARAVSHENANRNAAKQLRAMGAKIDAGNIRHLRALIERYQPEILPATLREHSVPAPDETKAVNNVTILEWPKNDEFRARRGHTTPWHPSTSSPAMETVQGAKIQDDMADTTERAAPLGEDPDKALERLGLTLAAFLEALVSAHSQHPGRTKSEEDINREVAKALRAKGARVDTESIRRVRRLLERYKPEILSGLLRRNVEPTDQG